MNERKTRRKLAAIVDEYCTARRRDAAHLRYLLSEHEHASEDTKRALNAGAEALENEVRAVYQVVGEGRALDIARAALCESANENEGSAKK